LERDDARDDAHRTEPSVASATSGLPRRPPRTLVTNPNHRPDDGASEGVDAALRHHLCRTDPATGLANRLVLVELLRSLAMPPMPHELVGGVTIAVDDLVAAPATERRRDRETLLRELGAFVRESAPEHAIAASVVDGLVLILFPELSEAKIRAVAARSRALWMRRPWTHRGMPRPRVAIAAISVPVAGASGGWFDALHAACRDLASRRVA
jgi:GGDEF domain-containing protein